MREVPENNQFTPYTHSLTVAGPAGTFSTKCARCEARLHTVCGALPIEDLGRLSAIAVPLTLPAGRRFITEGDAAAHFFTVSSGTAMLVKGLADGRRQVTGFAGVGHFLGLAVANTYSFSAEAVDDTRVCRYSRVQLNTLLADAPAMRQRIMDIASNELVAAQAQMLLLGRKTARERLATFLTGLAPRADGAVATPMTRRDIADYLGLTIETVCRTLTRMQREGLIRMQGSARTVIVDRPALRALAGDEA